MSVLRQLLSVGAGIWLMSRKGKAAAAPSPTAATPPSPEQPGLAPAPTAPASVGPAVTAPQPTRASRAVPVQPSGPTAVWAPSATPVSPTVTRAPSAVSMSAPVSSRDEMIEAIRQAAARWRLPVVVALATAQVEDDLRWPPSPPALRQGVDWQRWYYPMGIGSYRLMEEANAQGASYRWPEDRRTVEVLALDGRLQADLACQRLARFVARYRGQTVGTDGDALDLVRIAWATDEATADQANADNRLPDRYLRTGRYRWRQALARWGAAF